MYVMGNMGGKAIRKPAFQLRKLGQILGLASVIFELSLFEMLFSLMPQGFFYESSCFPPLTKI